MSEDTTLIYGIMKKINAVKEDVLINRQLLLILLQKSSGVIDDDFHLDYVAVAKQKIEADKERAKHDPIKGSLHSFAQHAQEALKDHPYWEQNNGKATQDANDVKPLYDYDFETPKPTPSDIIQPTLRDPSIMNEDELNQTMKQMQRNLGLVEKE